MKSSICKIFIFLLIPVCLPGLAQAQGIRLSDGVHLVMQGSPSLVLNNAGIINNGNMVTDSGTIAFTGDGSTGPSSIGGNQFISFYNVRIDNSLNGVELDNDIIVSGSVLMNHGKLQLNNHRLDLGSTGMISGESNNSFITGTHGGTIRVLALLNAPQAMNPGNIGVELTSKTNLGLTEIIRGHAQQTGSDGETSIQRYFDIAPEFNTGLNASIRFFYLDDELQGNSQNELTLFTSLGKGNSWLARGKEVNHGDHSVMENQLDQLHRFTLAVSMNKTGLYPLVHVYPNPTMDGFTLMLYSTSEKTEVVQLYDYIGHLLERKEWHCHQGTNSIHWNIGKYNSGVYLLRFENPALRNLQIVKQ